MIGPIETLIPIGALTTWHVQYCTISEIVLEGEEVENFK